MTASVSGERGVDRPPPIGPDLLEFNRPIWEAITPCGTSEIHGNPSEIP